MKSRNPNQTLAYDDSSKEVIEAERDVDGNRWKHVLKRWLVNQGPPLFFLMAWVGSNIAVFIHTFLLYRQNPKFKIISGLLGYSLSFSRAAGANINLNIAFLVLAVCRNFISVMRTTFLNRIIPFDHNIAFHKLVAFTLLFFVVVHTLGHLFNVLHVSKSSIAYSATPIKLALLSGPGITGHIGLLVFFLMFTTSLQNVRRAFFELFWYTHHLFLVFFAVISIHGTYCFLFANDGSCISPIFWKALIGPLTLYTIERIAREVRARHPTTLAKVILHPSKVIELQMKKPGFVCKSGQYIFINCPDVSLFQWHPFTMTNAPEEGFVSVHMRITGDWTGDMAKRLGVKFGKNDAVERLQIADLPRVLIDGPYGTASEDLFTYEVAVCVGAGIGQTPFASLLKSIWYRHIMGSSRMKLKKVYFFGICRDTQAFSWFLDVLKALEEEDLDHFIEIYQYLTGNLKTDQVENVIMGHSDDRDPITGLKAATHFGRPNFDQIFQAIKNNHPSTDIGVFFCGPVPISNKLHECCNKYTSGRKNGTRFFYNKENF